MALSKLNKRRYRKYPLDFFEEVLEIPRHTLKWSLNPEYRDVYVKDGEYTNAWDGTPDPVMEILHGIRDGYDVGVEAGTGLSKTFTSAALVLYFLAVYGGYGESCQAITFAPTENSLKNLLWKEIQTFWPKFQKVFPKAELLSLEIRMDPDHPDWKAIGIPIGVAAGEQSATRAQGLHAVHQLIILEECPGIAMPVIEAAINTNTDDHNMILAIGNPDNQSDGLHQFCMLPSTRHIRMSAYDHPNIVCQRSVIPGGPSQAKIDNRLARYGNDHPLFMSRVRGFCPDVSEMGLFTQKDLSVAKEYFANPIEEITNVPGTHSHGWIRIYAEPKSTHLNRYIIFGDVAGDDGKGDFHAAIVFDRLKKEPSAIIRMRGPREDYITALLAMTEKYKVMWTQATRNMYTPTYWYPLLAWERVGVGALILDPRLKEYPNLYRKRNVDVLDASIQRTVGWDTTGKSRKDMIEALQNWGLELRTHPWRMKDKEIWKEAAHFVWVARGKSGRYEAQQGVDENGESFHDDLMMALAGALVIDQLIPEPEVQEKPPKDVKEIRDEYFLKAISYRSNHTGGDKWLKTNRKDPWDSVKIPVYDSI